MKKIVLTYGIIAGMLPGLMFFIAHPTNGSIDFEGYEWTGWINIIAALSCIFLAVKRYRDKHLTGIISFGKAFRIGLLVSLTAGLIYVTAWEIYSATIGANYADQYMVFIEEQLSEQAKSADKIKEELKLARK